MCTRLLSLLYAHQADIRRKLLKAKFVTEQKQLAVGRKSHRSFVIKRLGEAWMLQMPCSLGTERLKLQEKKRREMDRQTHPRTHPFSRSFVSLFSTSRNMLKAKVSQQRDLAG